MKIDKYGLFAFLFIFCCAALYHCQKCKAENVIRVEPLIKIAVIDTGSNGLFSPKFCKEGSYDYVTDTTKIVPISIHGSVVTGVIAEQLKSVNYCILQYQVFNDALKTSGLEVSRAILNAVYNGAAVINLSLEGHVYDLAEDTAIRYAVVKGVRIYVAAGNDYLDLDNNCSVYPACYHYDNLITVGALNSQGKPCPDSNHGRIVREMRNGEIVLNGVKSCATSFAVPRALSDFVLSLSAASASK